ncbi:hypothetical protein L596_016080 [Steinernema carpocapsae]|uniref:L-dopachrome isomerase n=1 Tax=Steinernema carpocapsae TaxID=34508 RepID=A0A4U5NHW7_STECR|nr:hypothetical protein L596_016080 [Steinernema carpocapsae]
MPLCVINTTTASYSPSLPKEVTEILAKCTGLPVELIMVDINVKKDLYLGSSNEPCAYVFVVASKNIDKEHNQATSELLFPVLTEALGVDKSRMFIQFKTVELENVAIDGHVLG